MQPAFLYKFAYAPHFLDGSLFRFSQPRALNDPDEARPELLYSRYSPEDYIAARRKAQEDGNVDISDSDLELLYMTFVPRQRYDEKRFPALWPVYETRIRPEPFCSIAEFDRALAEHCIKLCRDAADKYLGVFSLSDSETEMLWAYYGNNHSGISVKFDKRSRFFNGFCKVEYGDNPIHVSTNDGIVRVGGDYLEKEEILENTFCSIPSNLILRKKNGWSHEREWRGVRRLADAKIVKGPDLYGWDVHLFEVPASAILELTFGYRASDEMVAKSLERIERDPQWRHLVVYRRHETPLRVEIERLR